MTMSSPKNSLSKPIKTRVVRADHRAVTYIWNRGEGLYRLPERLLVLGEFAGPGFLTGRSLAESPNPLTLLGPDGGRTEWAGAIALAEGRHLVIAPRDHPGAELSFRNFDLAVDLAEELPKPYEGLGWLVSGSAELDGAREVRTASNDAPIPFYTRCEPISDARVLCGSPRTFSEGGWEMADIEALKANGLWVQNLSKPESLTAFWPNGDEETRIMACHLNEMRWTIPSERPVTGMVLYRTHDAFHGLSQARVFVNVDFVGRWLCPEQDRKNRWRQSCFGIEFDNPLDAGSITITIDPPAGAPLWSVSAYRWLLFHD